MLFSKSPHKWTDGDDLQSLRASGVDRRFRESGRPRPRSSAAPCAAARREDAARKSGRSLTVNGQLELVSFTVVSDCRRLREGIDVSHHSPSYCGRCSVLHGTNGTTDERQTRTRPLEWIADREDSPPLGTAADIESSSMEVPLSTRRRRRTTF